MLNAGPNVAMHHRLTSRLKRHFEWLAELPAMDFLLRVRIESLILKGIVGISLVTMTTLFNLGASTKKAALWTAGWRITYFVLLAPIIETLLFQTLAVRVAQFFTEERKILLLCGWLPFAAAHFTKNLGSGIAAGLIGGCYLSFTYVVWIRRSHLEAFLVTAGIHAIGNGIIELMRMIPHTTGVLLILIGTSMWVLVDAKRIGTKKDQIQGWANTGPWGWFVACLFLWIIAFPTYLFKRPQFQAINTARGSAVS